MEKDLKYLFASLAGIVLIALFLGMMVVRPGVLASKPSLEPILMSEEALGNGVYRVKVRQSVCLRSPADVAGFLERHAGEQLVTPIQMEECVATWIIRTRPKSQ